jgi:hypothetical protein
MTWILPCSIMENRPISYRSILFMKVTIAEKVVMEQWEWEVMITTFSQSSYTYFGAVTVPLNRVF